MAKSKQFGHCRLCGNYRPLTKEHVPPQAAFNSQTIIETTMDDWLDGDFMRPTKGKMVQGGSSHITLCRDCNSSTGAWYGNAFKHWCYEGASILLATGCEPQLSYPFYIQPLNVLKQIVSMTYSVNNIHYLVENPDLAEFVRDKHSRRLPSRCRVFVYFNIEGMMRRVGNEMALLRLEDGIWRGYNLTEISHPPFGYVVTTDGSKPDKRFCEITDFKRFRLDEWGVATLNIAVLPTHMPISLDYRTTNEIHDQAELSRQRSKSASN